VKRSVVSTRAADIRALNKVLDKMGSCTDDPPGFFAANWELHRRIAKLCGNTPVRGIYLTMIDFLQETVGHAQFPEFDGEAMLEVHRDLVAAIDAGRGPRSRRRRGRAPADPTSGRPPP
jgi:DNA-binding FadR family transcriptional regulator